MTDTPIEAKSHFYAHGERLLREEIARTEPPFKRRVVIGDCTLYEADCLELMPTLPEGVFDMIWTDPPYGSSNADGDLLSVLNSGKLLRKALKDGNGAKPIKNDDMDSMRHVVDGMLSEAVRVLNKSSCCCCCCGGGGPRPTFAWLAQRMDEGGLSFFHSVIWDKKNPGLGWRYKRQHEMVMVAHKKNGRLSWASDAKPVGNIVTGFHPGAIRQHPNEKPSFLVEGFIERHSERNATILDPFMGGGTTGVACVKLGRKFTGIELDSDYFDIACQRIEEAYRQPDMFIESPAPKPEQLDMLEGEE